MNRTIYDSIKRIWLMQYNTYLMKKRASSIHLQRSLFKYVHLYEYEMSNFLLSTAAAGGNLN